MGNSSFARAIVAALALGLSCGAQVLSFSKIKDPESQLLQQRYNAQLRELGADVVALHFPYPFYLSDVLDIDEQKQKQLPRDSVHFDRFNNKIVLEITGNYYASYSTTALTPNQRARKTFEDVVLPLLQVAVSHVDRTVPFDAYGFEIAHHIRSTVMKVVTEGPENLVVVLPRTVAERLAKAKDVETRQSAVLESEVFLNAEPLTLWLSDGEAPLDVKQHYLARRAGKTLAEPAPPPEPGTLVSPHLIPDSELLNKVRESARAAHDTSPLRLQKLDAQYAGTLQKLVPDLDPQAHFVDYAPPSFIAFHDGAFLQLNLNTNLEPAPGSSQYRIAALAFDTHVAHLLRRVSRYFHENPQFEGIDFSTTVHQSAQPTNLSVEYVIPLSVLVCYEKYDCTGQELINRSMVLINGERVTLDLQSAESDFKLRN